MCIWLNQVARKFLTTLPEPERRNLLCIMKFYIDFRTIAIQLETSLYHPDPQSRYIGKITALSLWDHPISQLSSKNNRKNSQQLDNFHIQKRVGLLENNNPVHPATWQLLREVFLSKEVTMYILFFDVIKAYDLILRPHIIDVIKVTGLWRHLPKLM